MKTVVLGLFDDLETARRVLNQLAASPLDLDQISVVHGDLETQRNLAREAGLPAHRSPLAGMIFGTLVGAAIGYIAGAALAPDVLGPLMSIALGAMLGAIGGAAMGALSETVRVPRVHQLEVLQAIAEGATALIVRSDNLPTARAVGDLFRVSGSRELSPLDPGPAPAPSEDDGDDSPAETVEPVTGVVAEPLGGPATAPPGDAELSRFAPPTAPPTAPATAPATPPAVESVATMTPAAAPSEGETLYAPPWRRGVVDPASAVAPPADPRAAPPAPSPTASPAGPTAAPAATEPEAAGSAPSAGAPTAGSAPPAAATSSAPSPAIAPPHPVRPPARPRRARGRDHGGRSGADGRRAHRDAPHGAAPHRRDRRGGAGDGRDPAQDDPAALGRDGRRVGRGAG
ncbi:MAG: hypothetical protein U0470_09535 [Anaerolineae bacterium]